MQWLTLSQAINIAVYRRMQWLTLSCSGLCSSIHMHSTFLKLSCAFCLRSQDWAQLGHHVQRLRVSWTLTLYGYPVQDMISWIVLITLRRPVCVQPLIPLHCPVCCGHLCPLCWGHARVHTRSLSPEGLTKTRRYILQNLRFCLYAGVFGCVWGGGGGGSFSILVSQISARHLSYSVLTKTCRYILQNV